MLAPMAGVSDLPFRLITRAFGAPLAFTEMIDVRSLSQKDKRTILTLPVLHQKLRGKARGQRFSENPIN
jgi:tRNA-dihydrouridine synthase